MSAYRKLEMRSLEFSSLSFFFLFFFENRTLKILEFMRWWSKKKKIKSIAIRISVLLCGTGCRPPNDSKPQNKTSTFRSHECIVRVLTLLAATFSLIVFNHRLVRFVLHEKSVRVSIALEHNHPQSKGTNSTELILDSCSELLLDQYCLYKGSDLSVMALPTNWPSPGTGVPLRGPFSTPPPPPKPQTATCFILCLAT